VNWLDSRGKGRAEAKSTALIAKEKAENEKVEEGRKS
jgi:hypothetical protein